MSDSGKSPTPKIALGGKRKLATATSGNSGDEFSDASTAAATTKPTSTSKDGKGPAKVAKRVSARTPKPVDSFTFDDDALQGGKSNTAKSSKAGGDSKVVVFEERETIPTKNEKGELEFPDHPEFRPNMTPKEVIQAGSFGGTYYRSIQSGVTGLKYDTNQWKEYPEHWFSGLKIGKQVTSQTYDTSVNKYGVQCGGGLDMWEGSGWITEIDPYGWYQWYCRFYLGRRSSDDERQISRGLGVMGPKGRWRSSLVNKCVAAATAKVEAAGGKLSKEQALQAALNDFSISPKVRQLLQHWGYRLTLEDLKAGMRRIK